MAQRDYYEILGVSRTASADEIKRAYRKLVKQYHPDIYDGPDADARIKEINEAYEVLGDDQKRAAYDRFGHAGVSGAAGGGGYGPAGGGFTDIGDIFEEIFGAGFGFGRGGGGRKQGPIRGADIRYDLTIEFEEAVMGAEKEIEVTRHEVCPRCHGSGAEPGTHPMKCPTCNGMGQVRQRQQTIFGTFVNVTTCPRCKGTGEIVTTPCRECHGTGQVEVTRRLRVKIPAGVQDGTRIRLPGEGEPGQRGGQPHDGTPYGQHPLPRLRRAGQKDPGRHRRAGAHFDGPGEPRRRRRGPARRLADNMTCKIEKFWYT